MIRDYGRPIEQGLSDFLAFLPTMVGFLLIIVIGYFISLALGAATRKALHGVKFDEALHKSVFGDYLARVFVSPSNFTGKVVFWLVFLFFLSMAASVLQLQLLNEIVSAIYSYIPNVVAAIVIFLVASAIAAGASPFVERVLGNTAMAKLIGTIVPVVTLTVAAFMILNELGVATDIVNILFTAIVGAVALGMALAFGLGGRDLAKQVLQQAYDAGQKKSKEKPAKKK